jgi:hypothetical protein
VDPIILSNPYAPGVQTERFPNTGKPVVLVNCPKCSMKRLPYVFAPRHRAFVTRCGNCGTPVAWKDRDTPWSDIQRQGIRTPVGPVIEERDNVVAVDATRRYQELKAKREWGGRWYKR